MASCFGGLHFCLYISLLLTCLVVCECGADQFQYVLAFPKHVDGATPQLTISPLLLEACESLEVSVMSPISNSSGEIFTQLHSYNFSSGSDTQWLLSLDSVVYSEDSGFAGSKGILVSAPRRLIVQAKSLVDSNPVKSTGSFSVLSTRSLDNEYVIGTEYEAEYCFFLVVNPEGSNNVVIQLQLYPDNKHVTYNSTLYYSGEVIQDTLSALDVLQVLGYRTDLTGTRVTSSRPVAVIAGANQDCVVRFGSSCWHQDMILEQLPPLSALGTQYVFSPFQTIDKLSVIKICYTSSSTRLSGLDNIDMEGRFSLNATNFFMFELTGNETINVEASHSVLALGILLPPYVTTRVRRLFDPSLTIVAPVSKWGTQAEVLTFEPGIFEMVITASCACVNDIVVNATSVEELYAPTLAETYGRELNYCSREMKMDLSSRAGTTDKIRVIGADCRFSGIFYQIEKLFRGWAISLMTYEVIYNVF